MRDMTPASPAFASAENGWWYARFRLNWPDDSQVSWHLDLFLAHQIVLPIIEEYKPDIYLWRFHRRAVRDSTGHQFSFIFFCSAQSAYRIFEDFRDDDLLREAKAAGLVVDDFYDDTSDILRPNIEDTSDKKWSPYIQASWPYYIMGVSQMWLGLIIGIAEDFEGNGLPVTVEEIDTFYRKVDSSITALWEKEGRHAFLHHLNAIFGYQPIIYYEKRTLRF
jgi:hypothetical protein